MGLPGEVRRRMGVPGFTKTGVRGERCAGAQGCNPWGIYASGALRWGDAVSGSRYPCLRRHIERQACPMRSPSRLAA